MKLQVAAGKKVAAPKPKNKAETKARAKATRAVYNFKENDLDKRCPDWEEQTYEQMNIETRKIVWRR